MTLRFVCIVAVPRTGSSHLMALLAACSALNTKGELFHGTSGDGGLTAADRNALKSASGGSIADTDNSGEWRRSHPRETLDTLFRSGAYAPIIFKLFPGHLKKDLIRSDIFSRDDVAYVVLKRRPIDSFISGMKARKLGVHGKVETTAIKPALETEVFVRWSRSVKHWYRWVEDEIERRNLPCVDLSYEDHLDGKPNAEALSMVLDALAAIGFQRVEVPAVIETGARQDREPRFQDRVANWKQFKRKLRARKRQSQLLDWAKIPGSSKRDENTSG
jgi:hypothetical protein